MSAKAPGERSTMLEHKSLPERVHQILRQRILDNDLPAGTALVELPLAAEFGVSRTTIRSALRELHADRLIEISPRRGSTVTRMSQRDIDEVCYARYVLEAAGLPEVLETGRAALVRVMAEAVEHMKSAVAAGDTSGVILADTELHRAIVSAANHPVVIDMWDSLNGQMGALMRSDLDRQGIEIDETVRRHARLVTAVRRQSPDRVVAALHRHYLGPPPD
jgi:GntR family transcriptional regulator, rspAB operon transcriptional repressor